MLRTLPQTPSAAMRPVRRVAWSVSMVLVAACAGGTSGPILTFQPTSAPLRYEMTDNLELTVEVPGQGTLVTDATTEAVIAFEIGGEAPGGRAITATYESLNFLSSSQAASSEVDGAAIAGQPFRGTLARNGMVVLTEGPAIPSNITDQLDPKTMLAAFFPPLPPEGGTGASWPHQFEIVDETALPMTVTYDGTARFAGDTLVAGQPARIIVSEGTITMSGRGTPPGAPSEVQLSLSGSSRTTYVWDPLRGMMLGAAAEASGDGNMEMLGFGMTLPVTAQMVGEVKPAGNDE